MFAANLILFFVVAANASPLPYISIVETPTSRVVQHVVLSPQRSPQPYRIQPHEVLPFSDLHLPKNQPVYYYSQTSHQGPVNFHHPGSAIYHNAGNGNYYHPGHANLQQLRQEFWQELWNQFLGQTFESQEQTSDETSAESSESLPAAEKATTTTQELELTTKESNKIAPSNIVLVKSGVDKPTELVQPVPLHHFYDHNHQYYAVNGAPRFYGTFHNAAVSPIVSVQELQPIKKTQETNVKVQKITPLPMLTTEATSTLRINVPDDDDEDDVVAKGREASEESESEDLQSPSKDEKKMLSKQENGKESASEDRDLSDESSIAQAKPSGIAIAGNGGVASSKPVANAITGLNGLSVASPSATALAGEFAFGNDYDDDKKRPRQPNLTIQAYKKTIKY